MNVINNAEPKVSVIIPTFKRADMLQTTIDILIGQLYKNIEIIVVDDNNPDTSWRKETSDLMKKYKDEDRVIYIKHERNKNGSAARNTGFGISNGHFICFLDDDDLFYPEKITKQVKFLLEHRQFDACCCDYVKNSKQIVIPDKEDYSEDILLLNATPQTSGIMFRRDAIVSLGGFDESYIRHQDYELLLRFFSSGMRMGKINEVLYERIVAENDNTPSGPKMELVKKKFLCQFDPIIKKQDIVDKNFRKKVYIRHYIQLLKCFIKSRNYFKALFYSLKAFFIKPSIFINEIKRQLDVSKLLSK